MTDAALGVAVNGRVHAVPATGTLAELVARLGHAPAGVATAVNGEFVARDRRAAFLLRDGDNVNCFQVIVGG
jgi:sulfur carrier protein